MSPKQLVIAVLGVSIATALFAAPSAFATTGSEAVAACSTRADCHWSVGWSGDIVIFVDGHVIWCDGDDGDCVLVARPNFSDRLSGERADIVLAAPAGVEPASPPPGGTTEPTVRDHRTRGEATVRDHRTRRRP